ncbi:MAG TPA: hypothetical protein DDX04_01510 [Massilia sp.]|nr:hypothetical protein [Massilia sp.]
MFVVLGAGCSPLKLAQERQQAKPVDFGELYNGAMVSKYKKQQSNSDRTKFEQLMFDYDDAENQRAVLEKAHREVEQTQRDALDLQVQDLNKAIIEANKSSASAKKEKEDAAIKMAHIDKEKEALGKRPQTDDSAMRIAQMNLARSGYSAEMEVAAAMLILFEAELVRLRDNKLRISASIATLNKDDDPVELKKRGIRDQIVKDYLALADANYFAFKDDLLTGRAATDTIGDIAELLLSTATTLTGGVNSKTNLAAASTLLKGSRATVDKNFFAQQTMRAIINSIEAGRASDRLLINENLKKSTANYPLSEAIAEAQHYQSRASLSSAVLDIANQTGTNAALQTLELNKQVAPDLRNITPAIPSP